MNMFRLSILGFVLVSLTLVACSKGPTPKAASEATPGASTAATAPPQPIAARENNTEHSTADVDALLALLPSAQVDLETGIAQAEREGARAISAKFEIDDGHLSLSVYTAKKGIAEDAEHNVLAELTGDPTGPAWQPTEEIFADTKHLTRAAYHLTLVQRSQMTLAAVIAKALAKAPGQVYSVEPGIHDRSPIFHVLIATVGGGHVKVDVESGA